MEPNFDKIQTSMVNGLKKTEKRQDSVRTNVAGDMVENSVPSFSGIEETGTAGRSSVVMDNIDTDIKRFMENPDLAGIVNMTIEKLCKLGYSYEDAIQVAMAEFAK